MPDGNHLLGTAIGATSRFGGKSCGACVEVDPGHVSTEGRIIIAYG